VGRKSLAAAAAAAAVLWAVGAGAQALWYERYQRGIELEAQSAWEPALKEFEAAARVESRPRKHIATYGRNFIFEYDPHYRMARCLTELRRYPAAVLQLRAAMRAGVTPRPLLDELRTRIEDGAREILAPPTPALTAPPAALLLVTSTPAGARVTVDGSAVGVTPLAPLAVSAGEHTVRIEAAGYQVDEERVTVPAGGTYSLDRALRPLAAPAAAPPRQTAVAAVVPTPARRTTPTAPPPTAPPPPTTTEVVLAPTVAPAVASPAAPVQVGRGGWPAWLQPALWAALAVAVLGGALWWSTRRRRLRNPSYTPTRVLEATPTQIKAGQSLGAYELTGLLGRGGMATTYRATRAADGSAVALKVPHEGCFTDPTYLVRFLREGRLGEQLHHPRIVRIYEASEQDGRPFLAMELLAGRTLKQELRERGPFAVRRAVEVAADIAEALDYAHVKGVVHRDLKPENVMVLPDGSIKVMDFGIARLEGQEGLTSSQYFLGTPLYAAPEMIEPRSIDLRVDLYSLGIIMFEMLQGAVPFTADSPFKVLQMHQREPLPPLAALARPVPEAVWRVVERLCAKSPADRHPSAEALLVELHALLRALPLAEGKRV
jgi:hypothetical protein